MRIIATSSQAFPGTRRRAGSRRVLPVEQHDVEVVRVGEAAELVELLLRIDAVAGRHFRHQLVAVARNALQGDAQHPVHLAVRFGRLEEADTAIVGVAHQPRERVLPELALDLPADGARAEREPRDFHSGPAERDQVGRTGTLRADGHGSGHRKRSRGEPALQEFASSEMRHVIPSPPRIAGMVSEHASSPIPSSSTRTQTLAPKVSQ
jgi:hypothetical protein